MTACEFCEVDNGNYDFSRDCCLVRFILHVPTKTLRAGYLAWWVTKYGQERTDRVKALIQQGWDESKRKALGHGKTTCRA